MHEVVVRPKPAGVFELADADWQDDHHYWDIDFAHMSATFWEEGAQDDWSGAAHHLRRTAKGRWQYFENETQWAEKVARLRECMVIRRSEPTDSYPPFMQADVLRQAIELERELKAVEARGPSWLDFPAEMSEKIEAAWSKP